MAVRDGAPEAPVSSAPVVAGFPAAIARAGLGTVGDERGGTQTVTFGVPDYVPFSTAPMTVSRDVAEAAPEAAPAPEPEPAASGGTAAAATPAPAPAAPSGTAGGGDPDKMFEDLYDRLKRELLLEQEQLGQAFREP
jgi:hypothetical protein